MAKVKAKGEKLHETEILTNQLASILGRTPQWVRSLTRDGVLKQSGRGKYILGETIQAYSEYIQGGKEDANKPRYVDAKTAHEFIKKEKAELELRAIKGQLHESKDVRAVMSDMILTVKSKLLSISTRISPQLDRESAKKIEEIIHKEISDALKSFVDYSPQLYEKKEREE